ncbi:MAG: sigma-54-dependent Fis family transcriptional regulator, partial [Proteobacteria bacterium]|nr:sigma-54-dependent Fis family transcriptional regulator [Pseudomonadota bacterium]
EFTIRTPALRKWSEDIPYLAKKFMDEVEAELKKKCAGFSKEALVSLAGYHWPGNVRELRNVIRQAVLLCEENSPIRPDHLTFSAHLMPSAKNGKPALSETVYDRKESLKKTVKRLRDSFEKGVIEAAMATSAGNKSEVARRLKVDYKTLFRKMKMHGIG